jgi:hypothetical protein
VRRAAGTRYDTIERRRGRKLTARAIYYDAARSSKACFQKRERLTLDVRDLAGAGALGRPGLGAALSPRPVLSRNVTPPTCKGAGGTSRWWSAPGGF